MKKKMMKQIKKKRIQRKEKHKSMVRMPNIYKFYIEKMKNLKVKIGAILLYFISRQIT